MALSIGATHIVSALAAQKAGQEWTVNPNAKPTPLVADIKNAVSFAQKSFPDFVGVDDVQKAEVSTWVSALSAPFEIEALLKNFNEILSSRTYAAGYSVTVADAALYASISKSDVSKFANIVRWKSLIFAQLDIESVEKSLAAQAPTPKADAAVPVAAAPVPAAAPVKAVEKSVESKKAAVSASATASTSEATENVAPKAEKAPRGASKPKAENVNDDGQGGMPALEGAVMGQVVTRFPPEPSGYLHIGHVKAVLLNNYYARHYQGRLIIRFDDTNPSKEKDEFEQNIIDDLAALEVVGDFVSHTSDYFPLIAEYARQLISAGKAFMDDTPQEQMREERQNHIESRHRNSSIETNMTLFENLLAGGPDADKWCLRAKIDMASPNGTLRDPVIYRYNATPHHRTGTKFCAYPTYDLACPIVDTIEGVTHALRTNEYHDRDAQYAWLQDALGIRKVIIHEFSRLNFIYTLLSKRKLNWFVENKLVNGWYDPRFPTVQGMLRRGLVVPALKEFILSQGASKRTLDMEWDKFWSTNKRHIDPLSPRYTAIAGGVPVELYGEGLPSFAELRPVALHPKDSNFGTKGVFFSSRVILEAADLELLQPGDEFTLMKWGNAFLREITRDPKTNEIVAAKCELNLGGDFKKTKYKLTWISDHCRDSDAVGGTVPLELQDFDFLIQVPKLDEGDDFMSVINPTTKIVTTAVGEPALRNLKSGDIVQLERKGFFRVDTPYMSDLKPMQLFAIPDGKIKQWGVGSPKFLEEQKAKEAEKKKAEKAAKDAAAKAAKLAKLAAEQKSEA